MKSFEYNGYWWLPSDPQRSIAGNLKFDPVNGGSLDLLGSFKDIPDLNKVLEPNIILGFANGKKITLYQCYEKNSNMSMLAGGPVVLTTSFWANAIFVGHHFDKPEDIVFKSLSIHYSHLQEWVQITGFKFALHADKDNHLNQYDVSYRFPDKIEISVGNTKISFDYNFHDGGDKLKEFNLEQTIFLKIEPPASLHFDNYLRDIFYHLQNFLSLGVGRAVYPLIIKGKNENCKIQLEKEKVIYNDIEVFYQVNDFPPTFKKLHPFDMAFYFGDIKENFGRYLDNWFQKSAILQPVYDLYFAILYSSKMYLQHKFLSLTQALETYHRRIHGGEYVSNKDYGALYEALINAIPSGLDPDFKTSLKMRLKYHNEFSLRRRLREILIKCDEVTAPLVPNKESFIEDVVNTRNFLTHYDKSLEGKEKNSQELYDMTEKISLILEVCLFEEMGMTQELINKVVSRNRRYQHLVGKTAQKEKS